MAKTKTKPTEVTVESFLNKVADEQARQDSFTLVKLMQKVTGSKPKMWGPSIVGFGQYHYKYESGHEGDMCLVGFSPRKPSISVYVMSGFTGHADLLKKLGKFKGNKGCLYIKRLEDIDMKVLETLVKKSAEYLKKKYPDK